MNSNKAVVIGFGLLLLAFLHVAMLPPSMAAAPLIPRSNHEMVAEGSASTQKTSCKSYDSGCKYNFCCACSIIGQPCGSCCGSW
ncbi:unnamed protein product [Linum trigynum]|uniref:Uncharacterized protein n=1 Tax=Linum trigynum TaxID=586398 RepID=A0AAV2FHB0_9ROSI